MTRDAICGRCGKAVRTYLPGDWCPMCRALERDHTAAVHPCPICGTSFRSPGGTVAYCSPECRDTPRVCALEGCDKLTTGQNRRACPMHRQRLRSFGSYDRPVRPPKVLPEPEIRDTACIECDRQFVGRLVCSGACRKARRNRLERAARPPQPKQARTCPHCGRAFETTNPRQRHCTTKCGNRAAHSRRRAIEAGAYVEDVWRSKVYERDGYTCQLCHKPAKMAAEVPHPKAPTLDHIIPLAAGGTHEYANVQLAHFICNSIKSAGAGQLRLDIGAVA